MSQPAAPDAECQNVQAEIAKLFVQEMNVDVPSASTDLLDTGILDSQKFVELLVHLEQKFGARIDIEDFEIENFRSIETIANLVLRHKTSAESITSWDTPPSQSKG